MKAFAHVEPPGRSDRQDRRHHAATQQKHQHQPRQAAHAGLSWSGKGAHQKIVYAFLVLLQFLSRVIPCMTITAGVKGKKDTRLRLSAATHQRAVARWLTVRGHTLRAFPFLGRFGFAFFLLRS